MIAFHCEASEKNKLNNIALSCFQKLDLNNDGNIDKLELKLALINDENFYNFITDAIQRHNITDTSNEINLLSLFETRLSLGNPSAS